MLGRALWIAALLGLARADCDYVTLVKCFIEVLDEWAWTLYETKDNVVTVSDEGCAHFNTIRRCIQDENDNKHGCKQEEVIEASRTVSDLLTHRKHSGTFLKSYYLLEYACTDGREQIKQHQECLSTEMIGQQTLSAAGYLEEKFRESKPETNEDACSLLTEKLMKFKEIIGEQNLCDGEAEKLMCESLYRMFINVEAGQLGDCKFDCFHAAGIATSPEPPPAAVEEAEIQPPSERVDNGQEPASGASLPPFLHSLLLLGALSLLLRP